MLDISTAKLVKKAIDEKFKEDRISLEDVCKMTPAPVLGNCGGYTILTGQWGDLTILVWIQILKIGTVVRVARTTAW